jgi:hypothetical protein
VATNRPTNHQDPPKLATRSAARWATRGEAGRVVHFRNDVARNGLARWLVCGPARSAYGGGVTRSLAGPAAVG